MLSGTRVLDLTDERGQLAGAILAQLGAEVIAVEPPDGTDSRHHGPWAGDAPDPERSLWHWAYNRGKKSVVLDLGSSDGQAALGRLAATADIVFACRDTAVDLAALRAANPRLVTVTLSPFGPDGPRADWKATELTVWASAGPLHMAGDADRPPVRVTAPQGWMHGAGEAAGAALIALWEREDRSGLGQHVDISAQIASMQATQSAILAAPFKAPPSQRVAGGGNFGALPFRIVWPASDGHVTIAFLFGASLGVFTRRLMHWICEEGGCDEATRDKDWVSYAMLLASGEETMEDYARVRGLVEAFTATRTKAELLATAIERKLLIAPITTIPEVTESPQMAARGFWDDVEVADGEVVRFPGPFIWSDRWDALRLGRAPRVGEHQALLDELPATDTPSAAAAPDAPAEGLRALDGVKVLDFCWAVAGPSVTRVLADHGATVVRVESSRLLDVARTVGPFVGDQAGVDNAALWLNYNCGKQSLTLDTSKPEGLAVVEDLVRWADVLTESYAPGVLARMGIDDARLAELNPGLIVVHSSIMGQTGPMAGFAGIGTMGAAVTGFYNLTGWPDRLPAGPFSAYTDYVAPRFAVAALVAALHHRRRTGQGQILDFSQAEAATHFLTPAVLDWFVNGVATERAGNADPLLAPHGVYPSLGTDRWIAVAAQDDAAWSALAGLLGRADLAGLGVDERRARHGELDELIAAWTSGRDADDAAAALQAVGVAAYPVQNSAEAYADPQLAHLGHWIEASHATHGTITVEGPRAIFSRTNPFVTHAGPTLGEHADEILSGILGYDVERIADIAIAEALE